MQTEPRPAHEDTNVDVVILYAPRHLPDADFEESVAEWSAHGRAILVVLPRGLDEGTLDPLYVAGADLCVVAPTPAELFTHVECARRRHRKVHPARTPRDQQLDAFWATRRRSRE